MPKSISQPLPSILIPSVSPIARRMRPLSVGRLENAFHPTTDHAIAWPRVSVKQIQQIALPERQHWRLSRCLKVSERGRPRTRSHRRYHTETKHRHDDNKKNAHQGSHEPTEGAIPRPYPVSHGAPRRPRPIFADFLCACLARDRLRRSTCLRARDRLNVRRVFPGTGRWRRIRPIALCFGWR